MLAPLSWLSEYTTLPKNVKDLTDRLTSIGHMLDKIKQIESETVLDLELRGNRSDMFSIYGIARDIAAAYNQALQPLELSVLPKSDSSSNLLHVEPEVKDILRRYSALSLKITVSESPDWIKKKLNYFETPSINNVVDITNLVTFEMGQTLHAFDLAKIKGGKLILRLAKKDEIFHTIQQGLDVLLSPQDFVAADTDKPHCLSLIGGLHSKVTEQTKEIILESAVYDPANCRQSARRLKISTYGGNLHEKLLDPNQVEISLQRAVYLLQKYADARITSKLSDYYPNKIKPLTLNFDFSNTEKLSGFNIPESQQKSYLESLGFSINKNIVTVPTFRTDITQSADLVEEIIRIHGYDKIPETPLPGINNVYSDYPESSFVNLLGNYLTKFGLNEVITLPLISDKEIDNKETLIYPQNPPDPEKNVLRPSLIPALTEYATRQLNLQNPRVAIFEIGHVFSTAKKPYIENLNLAIIMGGQNTYQNWLRPPYKYTLYDLKGIIDKINKDFQITPSPSIQEIGDNLFAWEINLDSLVKLYIQPNPDYKLISIYPPIIEDFNIKLLGKYSDLETKIRKISPLINQIQLIDKFENKLTLRITFHDPKHQLTKEDIIDIRSQIENL